EVVGVAELVAELLELVPVALLALGAELLGEPQPEVGGDAVVVEQRVVDVEQEDGLVHGRRPSSPTAGPGARERAAPPPPRAAAPRGAAAPVRGVGPDP